jgi:hypothetical protein
MRSPCLWGKKLSCFEVVRGLSADEALIDGEAGCETTGEATSARSKRVGAQARLWPSTFASQ